MKKQVVIPKGVKKPTTGFNHIVKAGNFILLSSQLSSDVKDRKEINEIYKQYFSEGQEPTKVSVQAASPINGVDVEIEVIAVAKS
ncbi:MAG: hypothetical protein UT44_C0023G0016 [Candidatus Levybacteria bacterium GW2011_GWA1_39_32]|nr:MAG: hypothetical protein UT44_C0023G0016 [Candidatus Levybacteria bacterium GW2011_GWA1_39_32]